MKAKTASSSGSSRPKARILIKRRVSAQVDGEERTISKFEKHYIDVSNDYHTKHGIIKKDELQKRSGSLVGQGSNEFIIFDADFLDDYKHIRRLAQIITLKDIGAIIVNTGMTRDTKVLDAGAGSGALACYLGKIVKKVMSYDIEDTSIDVSRENVKRLCLKNVEVNKGDIYDAKSISEKGFDVVVLDVPEPWRALGTVRKSLRIGGFIAVYLPNISQVQEFVKALSEEFLVESTIESTEREWAVDARRTRPTTKEYSHTAFLTFVRRLR
ncbi:MAG: methyltransferase domain-containing protein [archaeon]